MIHGIYAIYDTVAKSIVLGLVNVAHTAQAIRIFADMAQSDNSPIARHIKDYELHQLGMINLETGEIRGFTKPHTDKDGNTAQLPAPEIVITGAAWLASVGREPSSPEEPHLRLDARDRQ